MTTSNENGRHPRCNGDDGNETAFHGASSPANNTGHLHLVRDAPAGVDHPDEHLLPQAAEGQESVRQRVVERLLAGDPEIIHAFQWGHGVGTQSTVDRIHAHAEAETTRLLHDLTDDGLTVSPIPPLENEGRAAA